MNRLRRPAPASMARRAVAATVDGLLTFLGVGVAGWVIARRLSGTDGSRRPPDELLSAGPIRMLGLGVRLAMVALRNVASPGQHLAGIRRVDAASGGPVSLRSAVTRGALELAWGCSSGQITRSLRRRTDARNPPPRRRIPPTPAAPGEEDAADSTTGEIAFEPGCLPALLAVSMLQTTIPLTARVSDRGQTVVDRLSGTIVVRS